MNPQLHLLQKHDLLVPFENEVLRVATNELQSSHELKHHLAITPIFHQLLAILRNYPNARGFREPASFIGSVGSHLSNHGHLNHSFKVCPIKQTIDDAFKICQEEII